MYILARALVATEGHLFCNVIYVSTDKDEVLKVMTEKCARRVTEGWEVAAYPCGPKSKSYAWKKPGPPPDGYTLVTYTLTDLG